jgi:hypothetical protein
MIDVNLYNCYILDKSSAAHFAFLFFKRLP